MWNQLRFPATLRIDYVRVWQKGDPKVGCDPADHPTSEYINNHPDLYANANLSRSLRLELLLRKQSSLKLTQAGRRAQPRSCRRATPCQRTR